MIKSLGLGYLNEGEPHPVGVDQTDHSDLESVQQPRRTDKTTQCQAMCML